MNKQKTLNVSVFVTYTYPYIGSGIGNVALKQSEELASLGHNVTIVSSNYPKTKKEFKRNGVKFIKLSAVRFLEKIHVPVPLYFFDSRVIRLIKYSDIIHVHDAVYPSSFLAALLGKIFKVPVVLTQHVPYITYPNLFVNLLQKVAYQTLGKMTFKLSDEIIIINPKIKDVLNINHKPIHLIPNGVDVSFFHPVSKTSKQMLRKKYKLPENKKIVLFVGRFVPKKGFELLFNARDNKYLLLFVGGGTVPRDMLKANNVAIFPPVSQNELREIYQLSDIFILPSHGEGFPLSIQEAMATGVPIITSRYNINDSSMSFIKTVELNSQAIKQSILNYLDDVTLVNEIKVKSRKYAIQNYSWEKNINRLLEIYEGRIR